MKTQLRCNLTTCAILLTGWACALVIFLRAGDPPDNPFAAYEHSKRFAHEVERMGGKSALLANDLANWFQGLWHGETLAFTMGVSTVVVAVIYYVIASDTDEVSGEP
jgi:hypothetical protein